MSAEVTWEIESERGPPRVVKERGRIVVHLGFLFVAGNRRCNVRVHLAAPPELENTEVRLRLNGGVRGALRFEQRRANEAAQLLQRLQEFWGRRAAESVDPANEAAEPALSLTGLKVQYGASARAQPDVAGVPVQDVEEASGAGMRSRSPRDAAQLTAESVPETPRRLLRRVSSNGGQSASGTPRRLLRRHSSDTGAFSPVRRQDASLRRALRVLSSAESPVGPQRVAPCASQTFTCASPVGRPSAEERERRRLMQLRFDEEEKIRSSPKQEQARIQAGTVGQSTCAAGANGVHCCIVCQDALRQVVFLPCKHLVCCGTCGKDPGRHGEGVRVCPVCRADVEWRLTVYL